MINLRAKNIDYPKNTMADLEIGQVGIITSVPGNPLLAPLGLRPGKNVKILTRESFNGPLVAMVGERSIAIERGLAQLIEIVGGEI